MVNLSEYDEGFLKFIGHAIHQLAKEKDPVLKMIRSESVPTIGPMLSPCGQDLMPSEPFEVKTNFSLSREAILSSNLGAVVVAINSSAEQEVKIIAPKLFETFEKGCDASGQSFDYGGKPFTVDDLLDVIEHIEYDFDEDGKPSEKMLVMGPKLAEKFSNIEWTTAQIARHEQIMDQKRRAYFAQKRSRRIP